MNKFSKKKKKLLQYLGRKKRKKRKAEQKKVKMEMFMRNNILMFRHANWIKLTDVPLLCRIIVNHEVALIKWHRNYRLCFFFIFFLTHFIPLHTSNASVAVIQIWTSWELSFMPFHGTNIIPLLRYRVP